MSVLLSILIKLEEGETFLKPTQYQISWKVIQWLSNCLMWTDPWQEGHN